MSVERKYSTTAAFPTLSSTMLLLSPRPSAASLWSTIARCVLVRVSDLKRIVRCHLSFFYSLSVSSLILGSRKGGATVRELRRVSRESQSAAALPPADNLVKGWWRFNFISPCIVSCPTATDVSQTSTHCTYTPISALRALVVVARGRCLTTPSRRSSARRRAAR